MSGSSTEKPAKRLLDPVDRISEVIFGLIMALTFTCTLSVAEAGREDVRVMLIGAIGCNIAWGIVDAVMFVMVSLTERARGLSLLRALRGATDPRQAREIIANALPPLLAQNLDDEGYAKLRRKLGGEASSVPQPRLGKDDFLGALGVFLLVVLATFPVVIPFMFMKDAMTALRVSNAISLVMLVLAGYSFGRYSQYRPWLLGLSMMVIGSVLVAITIALGG